MTRICSLVICGHNVVVTLLEYIHVHVYHVLHVVDKIVHAVTDPFYEWLVIRLVKILRFKDPKRNQKRKYRSESVSNPPKYSIRFCLQIF